MTIKELKKRVDAAYKKFADVKTDLVVLGDSIRFGEYVEDEEASEDNDWSPEGHWVIGKTVLTLPEKVEGPWR